VLVSPFFMAWVDFGFELCRTYALLMLRGGFGWKGSEQDEATTEGVDRDAGAGIDSRLGGGRAL
jgi:hypothetical protein